MCTEKWEGKIMCGRAHACVCMCLVLPEILTLQNSKCKADLFGICLPPVWRHNYTGSGVWAGVAAVFRPCLVPVLEQG